MAQNIFQLLRKFSQPHNRLYDGLLVRTKSGAEIDGSLVNWNSVDSPTLICITGDRGIETFLDIESIESVSLVNPAR